VGLFTKFKRAIGVKNKFALQEIKVNGKTRAATLLNGEERQTLGKAERQERFRRWRIEQGL
jgi:hypothetical protein